MATRNPDPEKLDTAANTDPLQLATAISDLFSKNNDFQNLRDNSVTPMNESERRDNMARMIRALGGRYVDCTFDAYEVTETATSEKRPTQESVFKAVLDFAATMPGAIRSGGGLVLFGRPGTGKDHLMAAALFSAIAQHGICSAWVNGSDLYRMARDLVRTQADEKAFCERWTKPRILAISDPVPPKDEISAYSADVVLRILDRRYRDMKSTWATMNASDGAEAEQRLASPIVDRLRHGSLCLKCEWPSHRKAVGIKEAA